MKTSILAIALVVTAPAFGQTMYKCPNAAGTINYQQMPCTPTGGGEAVAVKAIPAGVGSGLSDSAKAYLEDQSAKRQEKTNHAVSQPGSTSMAQHIKRARAEKIAEECVGLERRIRWVQGLEAKDVHIRQHSMSDEDSRWLISQYEERCGAW